MASDQYTISQMALTKISEAAVESSDGFRVRISRDKLTYSEQGGRYLVLEALYVPTERILHIYFVVEQRWMSKGCHDGVLDSQGRLFIQQRIASCLDLLQLRFEFHQD
jgi:hypothetical protein